MKKQNEFTLTLAKTRLAVAYLGEKQQFGWWTTSFFEQSAIRFLEPVFSRTAHLAQFHGAVEAARQFHDENLSVGTYHLFRFPEELEQNLHQLAQSGNADFFDPILTQDISLAFRYLKMNDESEPINVSGPVVVGNIADLKSKKSLNQIGKFYHSSFSNNIKALPYWVS